MSAGSSDSGSDVIGEAWAAAAAAGHDMTLLLESAGLTPTERLRLHELAVARLERLEVAMGRGRHGRGPAA